MHHTSSCIIHHVWCYEYAHFSIFFSSYYTSDHFHLVTWFKLLVWSHRFNWKCPSPKLFTRTPKNFVMPLFWTNFSFQSSPFAFLSLLFAFLSLLFAFLSLLFAFLSLLFAFLSLHNISPDKLKLNNKRLRDCFDCKRFFCALNKFCILTYSSLCILISSLCILISSLCILISSLYSYLFSLHSYLFSLHSYLCTLTSLHFYIPFLFL